MYKCHAKRLQGAAFATVKGKLTPVAYSVSNRGNVCMYYRKRNNRIGCDYYHWLNDSEKEEFEHRKFDEGGDWSNLPEVENASDVDKRHALVTYMYVWDSTCFEIVFRLENGDEYKFHTQAGILDAVWKKNPYAKLPTDLPYQPCEWDYLQEDYVYDYLDDGAEVDDRNDFSKRFTEAEWNQIVDTVCYIMPMLDCLADPRAEYSDEKGRRTYFNDYELLRHLQFSMEVKRTLDDHPWSKKNMPKRLCGYVSGKGRK